MTNFVHGLCTMKELIFKLYKIITIISSIQCFSNDKYIMHNENFISILTCKNLLILYSIYNDFSGTLFV